MLVPACLSHTPELNFWEFPKAEEQQETFPLFLPQCNYNVF